MGATGIRNSLFLGNSADSFGGGIDNSLSSVLTVTNSTLVANSASIGGALFDDCPAPFAGSSVLDYSTLSGNNPDNAATCGLIKDSILVLPGWLNCSPVSQPQDGGYNRPDDVSCRLTNPTSLADPNISIGLGPLSLNGGPTLTMLASPNSAVIDKIPPGTNGCGTTVTTDQRGVSRPQGMGCDIGAVEVNQS